MLMQPHEIRQGGGDFDESQHPRGQPGHPGQFTESGKPEEAEGGKPGEEKPEETGAGPSKVPAAATTEELAAVGQYQNDDVFTDLNDKLRRGDDWDEDDASTDPKVLDDVTKQLDNLVDKFSVTQETTVYRGVNYPIARQIAADWAKGEKPTFSDKGFVSTSLDRSIAEDFGGDIFEIVLPPGQRAFDVASLKLSKANEREILLPRGMQFQVLAVEKIDQKNYHIRAVPV
jgi:hypothetical protein